MGLNTWAAFTGTNADAMVAGDVAMLEPEVTPVLKALRANGLNVVAIHHHMTEIKPAVVFLHYYGTGPATALAKGVRAAVDVLGKSPTSHVLFMCPHGAAKSVLASAYFAQMARERGLNVVVDFAGTEPDAEVAPKVVERLKEQGIAPPATTRDVRRRSRLRRPTSSFRSDVIWPACHHGRARCATGTRCPRRAWTLMRQTPRF